MNYRSFELFNLEVIGFAILTDDDPDFHPKSYQYGRWNSEMKYKFHTYKLLEKHPKDYENSKNPFAAIMKTAWYGLYKNKLKTDEERLSLKLKLIRELLSLGYSHPEIGRVFDFIKYYVRFDKNEYYDKFVKQFQAIKKSMIL